jgi:hypothetical protein
MEKLVKAASSTFAVRTPVFKRTRPAGCHPNLRTNESCLKPSKIRILSS